MCLSHRQHAKNPSTVGPLVRGVPRCAQVCMYPCPWQPEDYLGCWSSGTIHLGVLFFFYFFSPFFPFPFPLRWALLLHRSLQTKHRVRAQGASCPCLPKAPSGVTTAPSFLHGFWTSVLVNTPRVNMHPVNTWCVNTGHQRSYLPILRVCLFAVVCSEECW